MQGNISLTPKGIADPQMKAAYAQARNGIINEFTTPDGKPKSATAKNALISIGVQFDPSGKAIPAKPESVLMGATTAPAAPAAGSPRLGSPRPASAPAAPASAAPFAPAVPPRFATPEVANTLRTENTELKKRLDRIPAVTERLVNDIRDISIAATAELLTDSSLVVLADDKKPEQGDTGANLDYFGDGNASEPDSESSGSEGSAGLPASNGGKRKSTSSTRPSSTNNG
jgi:hypothetical protein